MSASCAVGASWQRWVLHQREMVLLPQLLQISSQLVRGTFGHGEPHNVPVPVNLAELWGLGSHGACKTAVSGTEEEGIGGKRSWASGMG